ncbi:MAG: tRNA uridine-5-carboxymethylaminomethyl(34) synthesis GTPase MnmE [Oscillospiraceae bacterium]
MSTIAAISTGQAAGGIGIVRISGENALFVADRIFKSIQGKVLSELKGYTASFGKVFLGEKAIDDAVALVFKAPKSYTGEDVVEISCHGGLYITRQVLRAALEAGAVPAQAGEFTKRAFLNGKMDLTKAEAVMNMISAHSEQAGQAALSTLDGVLSKKIAEVTEILTKNAANMAAWVDYPDEEIEDLDDKSLLSDILECRSQLSLLISQFDAGQAIIEGVATAIIGRPNVGKSTLMNMLVGSEKSIVTSVAGTTRDVVEETVTLGDMVLRLADTAGLHETDDAVESIGVERAKDKIEKANLVLAVFDASDEINSEDEDIFKLCKDKNCIAIVNKTDLDMKIDCEILKNVFKQVIFISAKENKGYNELKDAVMEILGTADFNPSAATLINERQLDCCKKALNCIVDAENALKTGFTRDAINVCIDVAIENLMVLTGEKATETVVNQVFSSFCVGK